MMMREHDAAGEILQEIRAASGNYVLEPHACTSFTNLYGALESFEADLHKPLLPTA